MPREVWSELRSAIKNMKDREEAKEELCTYAAKVINERTREDISRETIRTALETGKHSISMKHYLTVCEVFGVKPKLSLHNRETHSRIHAHLLRLTTSEIDFLTPAVYKHPSGKTAEIHESEKESFIVINGRWLKAEKKKTRYGGEWWGLTLIEYVTEEGVYTVVIETGELWPPLVTPWFGVPLDWDIEFKTPQTLKELLSEIKNTLPQAKQVDLVKITGISTTTLNALDTGEKKTITLGQLLTLIALKSTLTQTDIKSEIQKIEKEIDAMEGRKLPKQRENMLYINIKTRFGAALIAHALGDGNLKRTAARRIRFVYVNTEYSFVEDVNGLLKHYGHEATINTEEGKTKEGKKLKDEYTIYLEGLLPYALYRAIPRAVGKKTKKNPKAPSEITKDPRLAPPFIRAMIKDEINIDEKRKVMGINIRVDVTEKLGEENREEIKTTAEQQVREKEREKGRKLTRNEEKIARRVKAGDVSEETREQAETVPCNILLSLKEALETLGIKPTERGIQHFYPSKKKDITACWRMYLTKDETEKAYEYGLLEGTGPKEKASTLPHKLERRMNNVQLVNPKKNLWGLSLEQIEKLEKHEKRIQHKGKEIGKILFSKIKDDPNLKDVVEIINNNTSERLEKKKAELEEKGIKTKLEPTYIYNRRTIISVEWMLEWFEPQKKDTESGRS
ncbi:MAG: hypothetical protein ACTSUQ_05010 [Candidatus Freyarchaeota archaeon]